MSRDLPTHASGARALGLLIVLLVGLSLACDGSGEAPAATPTQAPAPTAATSPDSPTQAPERTPAPPPTRVATQAPAAEFVPRAPNALGGIGGQTAEGAVPGNVFLVLFPELRDAPAPEWLRLGMRVTYRVQSATIAQAAGEEGSTGAGYLQYDFVALDEQAAVSTVRLDLDEVNGNGVIPFMTLPSAGIPGAGDFWIAPEVLRDAERVASDKLEVVRGPADLEGHTYQAVRFEYRDEGVFFAWLFEEETGLLTFYREEIGTETDPKRQVTLMWLVGERTVKLPWRGGTLPGWVEEGARLDYTGSYIWGSPAAGVPDTTLPSSVSVDLSRCGKTWCAVDLTSKVQGQPQVHSTRMVGAAQIFDAFWLPPEALDVLEDGQVLDRDPVTGARISVERHGDGTIVLTEEGAAYAIALVYDERDGMLEAMFQETHNGLIEAVIDLRLTGRP